MGKWRGRLAATLAAVFCAAGPAALAQDLDGLWSNNSLTSLERPDEFKTLTVSPEAATAYETPRLGKPPDSPSEAAVGGAESEWWDTNVGLARIGGQPRTSWIVSPADGKIPYTEAAKAANKARRERQKVDFDHPESRPLGERCLSTEASGPPLLNGGYNDNYQIVQTASHVLIVAEYMHDVRIVRLGVTAHPPSHVRVWNGDSVGRWEGRTLVVETTNFTPAEVLAPNGDASADMRVVEQFTPVSKDELLYAFRIENPARYSQPMEGEILLRRTPGPLYEFACHEANYSLTSILSGARQAERRTEGAAAAAGP